MATFGPLKRLPSENPFVVWDVETKPARKNEPINTAWLGAALWDGNGSPQVESDEERFFASLLSPAFKGYWVYAHNASAFDFHYLLRYLSRHKIPWTGYKTGQRLFVSAAGRTFLDSMAIIPFSLADSCVKLGVKTHKWKVDDDFYREIEKRPWREYLADDCRALYECIEIMRTSTRQIGGILRPTIASSSMTLFRLAYLDQSFEAPPPFAPEPAIWRRAYSGGRVEVFKAKMGRGCSWDINSSFPKAMVSTNGVPCELVAVESSPNLPDEPAICLADVTIPVTERHPPLPLVGRDKRLYFAAGHRRAWHTSEELQYCAEKYGRSAVRVIESHRFNPRSLFERYVTDLYAIKAKKAGPISEVAKLYLNSLYGKFSSRPERKQLVCGPEWHNWPHDNPKAMRMFARLGEIPSKKVISQEDDLYEIPSRNAFAPYLLPQIGATITARARLALQGMLDAAGESACYCDTDSLYAELSKSAFATTKDLGGLKLEAEIAQAIFAAPKAYWYKDTSGKETGKAKGLRRTSAQEVLRFIQGEAVEVKRILGIFETRRRTGKCDPKSEISTKKARSWSHRRHPDGRPYSVDELTELGLYVSP